MLSYKKSQPVTRLRSAQQQLLEVQKQEVVLVEGRLKQEARIAELEAKLAVLADGPPPSRMGQQFPPYCEMGSSEEHRHAMIHLHAQGWSISMIARYLEVPRPTFYEILSRWVREGVQGLADKSHANTSKPGINLPTRNLIRKKQEENPLLGEFRMYDSFRWFLVTYTRALYPITSVLPIEDD